jgi:hypothetical protein
MADERSTVRLKPDPTGDEALTAVDRAIAEALDVEPSAEFLARVRMRIANDPAPRGAWTTWMPAMVGAAVAAAAVAIAVIAPWRGSQVRVKPDTTTDVRLKPDTTTDTTTQVRLKADTTTHTTTATTTHTRPYEGSAFRRTGTAAEPEVLVPRAEIDMYRRLIARARTASPGTLVDAPPDVVADLQPPPELTIDPIKIDPITPQSSGEGVHP